MVNNNSLLFSHTSILLPHAKNGKYYFLPVKIRSLTTKVLKNVIVKFSQKVILLTPVSMRQSCYLYNSLMENLTQLERGTGENQ